jgi:AraC-like DNA-binding protein
MLLRHEAFRRLCQARDRLAALDDEPLSIDAVARAAAISPFHFIRQFEAVFGVTPHQYRIQCRLDEAKRLLAAGQHSVTEVCMAVGFSSLGSFSELFKRRVGAPPSSYQRRLRALSPVPEGLQRVLAPGCLSLMGQLPPDAFRSFREA